jgi:hypothetical protein
MRCRLASRASLLPHSLEWGSMGSTTLLQFTTRIGEWVMLKENVGHALELARSIRVGGGTPIEADEDLNDSCRALVSALKELHGECWLGKINLSKEDRQRPNAAIWKWDGDTVYNFGADFVVPSYDKELEELILGRLMATYAGMRVDRERVAGIMHRVKVLGGYTLNWS